MAQTSTKPKRLTAVIEALKKHGIKDEEVAKLQGKLDPLLLEEPEIHIHIEGDDTHTHVDIHELE